MAVDALRAVALLGIVVVNVAAYRRGVGPSLGAGGGAVGGETSPFTIVLSALTEGRFYPLFSFLFGWGFAVQDARSRERGRSVAGPWARRCVLLVALGLLHGLLLFDGDILLTYGLIGFALLLVRRIPTGWLAGIGVALVILQGLFSTGLVTLAALVTDPAERATLRAESLSELAEGAEIYATGSFLDVVAERAGSLAFSIPFGLISYAGTIGGMMVLGVAAARLGWSDPDRWPVWLRRTTVPMWLVGVALSIPGAWLQAEGQGGFDDAGKALLGWTSYSLLGPFVALTWAGVILLATRLPGIGSTLLRLAPAGRMTLTLYLSQSLIFSLVFNGYGLGLGAEVGIGVAVGMAVGLWLLQVLAASLWFRVFTMGPVEAVARAFAYLRWPGIRPTG